MAVRITSVCSASTNARLLLRCTRALTCHYRSYCYDNPKYECESEKKKKRKEKKNTALTVNFQPLPVITASLFGCTKAHVPQAAFSSSVFFFSFLPCQINRELQRFLFPLKIQKSHKRGANSPFLMTVWSAIIILWSSTCWWRTEKENRSSNERSEAQTNTNNCGIKFNICSINDLFFSRSLFHSYHTKQRQ